MNMNKTTLLICLSMAAILCLAGCKDWDYDVEQNGIHFKKISQSEAGTIIGYMTADRDIQGFPCAQGWIHFRPDWQLLSFQFSEDFMYKGTHIPAHTWFHFPYQPGQTGYVLSFPNDYEVQGHLCGGSGGYKGTHTGFYDSGRLRSFFAPEDVVIDGVPCAASLLVNVNLYENGKIKSCKLAGDYPVDGKLYKKGRTIEFDEEGRVRTDSGTHSKASDHNPV